MVKTDSLFYRLFQLSPSIFFELIGQPGSEADDYEFRSVEIKQTSFRIDGVLLPTVSASDCPVYFSEVQFQKDQQLYHRFFAEIFLYLAQNPATYDWQGILIYLDRSVEPDQARLHQLLVDSPKVRRVYLNELGEIASLPLSVGIVKLVVEAEETAPKQARQLIQRSRQEDVAGISSQAIIESDTPSFAGGLMSVTAPRADVLAQGCRFGLELTALVSRFLFADVATDCL
ncbi:MAG: Rpn family recombination-promoting nuclease/putative transposase [Leptolyngbya sp. BL-A-14]